MCGADSPVCGVCCVCVWLCVRAHACCVWCSVTVHMHLVNLSPRPVAIAMTLGALSCLVRPTAIFMWLPLAIGHLATTMHPVKTFVTNMAPVA